MSEPNRIVIDEYHGRLVSDPYRWLEGDGPAVADWISNQQARCEAYFSQTHVADYLQEMEPLVRQQLTREAIVGQILAQQNSYFYMRRRLSDQQTSIVIRHGFDGQEEVLVDPLLRDAEGFTSVELIDVSEGGKWLAYGVRVGGSHQQAVEILDLETRLRHPWSLPAGFLRSFVFEKDFTARYIHEDPAAEKPHLRRELRQRLLGEDHYQKVHYVAGNRSTCVS